MLIVNYIKTAWRNILQHKLFSIINVLGLAIGLAAVILITLFVRDELSYDKFWSKADNIYRSQITFNAPGRDPFHMVATPRPCNSCIKKTFHKLMRLAE